MSELSDVSKAVTVLDDAINTDMDLIETDDLDQSVLAVPISDVVNEYQNPWDRLPDETNYKWDLFCHYRDSGLQRTFIATAAYGESLFKEWRENSKGTGDKPRTKSRNRISRYSTKHRWKERAYAYDKEQERLYQLARSEAIRDMAARHETVIEKAIDGLMAPIEALSTAMATDPDFVSNLSKTDAKKLIDLSNRAARTIPSLMAAERLARGMPTEIVGGVVEHQHVVSVERDQIGEILGVLERAGVLDVGGSDSDFGEIVDAEVVDVHPLSAESDE